MTGTVFDLSATAGSNSIIEGVNVAEGCPAGNLNDGVRGLAAAVRNTFTSALQTFLAGTVPLPIANGGTAGTSAVTARTALGAAAAGTNSDITALTALTTAITLAQGGTGATDAATARTNIGAIGVTAASLASPGYIKLTNGFMIQWGTVSVGPNSTGTVTFPTAFTTFGISTIGGGDSNTSFLDAVRRYGNTSTTGFNLVNPHDSATITAEWLAVGV